MPKLDPNLDGQDCQIRNIALIQRNWGENETFHLPLDKQLRLFYRRHLSVKNRRKVKELLWKILWWRWDQEKIKRVEEMRKIPSTLNLQPGEKVLVRSKEEIKAMLDPDGKFKGCGFLTGMEEYCGTIQTVLKPVTRFVDERNYKIVKARGIVLLDGIVCNGTNFYGKCDRNCFLFFREEWLERI